MVSLLIAPVVLGVLITILLLLTDRSGPEKPQRRRPIAVCRPARGQFSALSISDAFDPECAVIWDTQVPALRLIAQAGHEGLPIEELYTSYTQASRRYPELYDGSTFESWLEFLRRSGLVSIGLHRVLRMPEAEQFLRYRVEAGELMQAHAQPVESHCKLTHA